MELCFEIGADIFAGATFPRTTKHQMVVHRAIYFQPLRDGLVHHPLKGIFCCTALCLRIAASNVGMHSRKPDLLDILRWALARIKRIELKTLRFYPTVNTKHTSPFVDRDRLTKYFHIRVSFCVWQLFKAGNV